MSANPEEMVLRIHIASYALLEEDECGIEEVLGAVMAYSNEMNIPNILGAV